MTDIRVGTLRITAKTGIDHLAKETLSKENCFMKLKY